MLPKRGHSARARGMATYPDGTLRGVGTGRSQTAAWLSPARATRGGRKTPDGPFVDPW